MGGWKGKLLNTTRIALYFSQEKTWGRLCKVLVKVLHQATLHSLRTGFTLKYLEGSVWGVFKGGCFFFFIGKVVLKEELSLIRVVFHQGYCCSWTDSLICDQTLDVKHPVYLKNQIRTKLDSSERRCLQVLSWHWPSTHFRPELTPGSNSSPFFLSSFIAQSPKVQHYSSVWWGWKTDAVHDTRHILRWSALHTNMNNTKYWITQIRLPSASSPAGTTCFIYQSLLEKYIGFTVCLQTCDERADWNREDLCHRTAGNSAGEKLLC